MTIVFLRISSAFFILFLPALCAEVKTDSNHTQFYPLEEIFLIRRIAEFWKDGDFKSFISAKTDDLSEGKDNILKEIEALSLELNDNSKINDFIEKSTWQFG